jgi:hypothetical protein
MFAIWWLTYLARVGLSPTGIIDLARTHTPFILGVPVQFLVNRAIRNTKLRETVMN